LRDDAGVPLAWITVPEPSAALLLGILVALGLARWERRAGAAHPNASSEDGSVIRTDDIRL
jgi:hypothetical protein